MTQPLSIPAGVDFDVYGLFTQTFGGRRLTQSWMDLRLWEWLLNSHSDIRHIIEIGTWEGGMSHFLAAQALHRGMKFTTFDMVTPNDHVPGFVKADVFREPEKVIYHIRKLQPVLLLCDGGDKPREMQTFAPYLHDNDWLLVHDWLDEAHPSDVPGDMVEVYGEICDHLQSHTRIFQKA